MVPTFRRAVQTWFTRRDARPRGAANGAALYTLAGVLLVSVIAVVTVYVGKNLGQAEVRKAQLKKQILNTALLIADAHDLEKKLRSDLLYNQQVATAAKIANPSNNDVQFERRAAELREQIDRTVRQKDDLVQQSLKYSAELDGLKALSWFSTACGGAGR